MGGSTNGDMYPKIEDLYGKVMDYFVGNQIQEPSTYIYISHVLTYFYIYIYMQIRIIFNYVYTWTFYTHMCT